MQTLYLLEQGRNKPKSLSGIETLETTFSFPLYFFCRNKPKSLSGIETTLPTSPVALTEPK